MKPPDPTGRADLLLSGALELFVKHSKHPLAKALAPLYPMVKPSIDAIFTEKLGDIQIPGVPHQNPEPKPKRKAKKQRNAKTMAAGAPIPTLDSEDLPIIDAEFEEVL